MTISSRTVEGTPSRCPLCEATTKIEFSEPAGDATCPNCGCLLWLAADVLTTLQNKIEAATGVAADKPSPLSPLKDLDLGSDSLDIIELVMELEEEFSIAISPEDARRIETVGDAIRYIEKHRR